MKSKILDYEEQSTFDALDEREKLNAEEVITNVGIVFRTSYGEKNQFRGWVEGSLIPVEDTWRQNQLKPLSPHYGEAWNRARNISKMAEIHRRKGDSTFLEPTPYDRAAYRYLTETLGFSDEDFLALEIIGEQSYRQILLSEGLDAMYWLDINTREGLHSTLRSKTVTLALNTTYSAMQRDVQEIQASVMEYDMDARKALDAIRARHTDLIYNPEAEDV